MAYPAGFNPNPPTAPTASRVLVTGASGFVGRAVCRELAAAGWEVVGQFFSHSPPPGVEAWQADLSVPESLAELPACAAIVHLAGLAHAPPEGRELLWRVNVDSARALAQVAAGRGCRFVFMSSAKVLGETGEWNDAATPAPEDAYACAKLAAETAIRAIPGLDYTILRPPLVFGPGAKGNAQRLFRLADGPWPLPLAGCTAPRSMIHVDHLASAIAACLVAPAAVGQTWLVADEPALSVAEVITTLRSALNRPPRLLALSPSLLGMSARLIGRGDDFVRLMGRFVLHPDGILAKLGWQPAANLATALRAWAKVWPRDQRSANCAANEKNCR